MSKRNIRNKSLAIRSYFSSCEEEEYEPSPQGFSEKTLGYIRDNSDNDVANYFYSKFRKTIKPADYGATSCSDCFDSHGFIAEVDGIEFIVNPCRMHGSTKASFRLSYAWNENIQENTKIPHIINTLHYFLPEELKPRAELIGQFVHDKLTIWGITW